MTGGSVRQYFGRSARHPRACVDLSFPPDGDAYRLAPLGPMLDECGLAPRDPLPEETLPLDAAVCRLACALATRQIDCWSGHGTDERGAWAALAYPVPPVAALALETSLALVRGDASRKTAEKLRALARWFDRAGEIRLWMSEAADLLGHASARVNISTEIYQLGQGAKGLHFFRMGNERDSMTGQMLETSKYTTIDTLSGLGLPTTRAALVDNVEQIAKAIARVGLPCVVKPTELSRGMGVATHLASEEQVEAAVAHALQLSGKPVLVENHVEGADHRLMVVGDELLWAYRRTPASVVGDGSATVAELVERENLRRKSIRSGTDAYLYKIAGGEDLARFVAARYGMAADHIVPKGERIDVAGQANIARGGVLDDVTGMMHPDNRAMAIRVARLFRVRTMGIDYLTPDISRSWKEVDSAIVEVNRTPAIWGTGDAALVQRTLFPNRLSGAIPTLAVVGDDQYRGALGESLHAAFAQHGLRLVTGDYSGTGRSGVSLVAAPRAIEVMTIDPEADAVVALCAPDRVDRSGLPLRRCDLLIAQDAARSPWLSATAQTVLSGDVPQAKLDQAIRSLARVYKDAAEGGPLPVLEPLGLGDGETFGVKIWRARAMPRAWFWAQAGIDVPDSSGLTTEADLLAAVRSLASRSLAGAALAAEFTHDELIGSWFRVAFEARLALPSRQRDATRAALLAAVERINAIAAAPIV
jgi:D-alanine-D-alanine ligase-like ATP-grasp enzyme